MEECGKRELDATTVHTCMEYWLCSLNCHSPPNIPLFSDYSGTQQRSIVRLTKFENKSGANQLHSWLVPRYQQFLQACPVFMHRDRYAGLYKLLVPRQAMVWAHSNGQALLCYMKSSTSVEATGRAAVGF